MANIGEPVRKVVVVPLKTEPVGPEPKVAPPQRAPEKTPQKVPEKVN